jgi:hypothetical protein
MPTLDETLAKYVIRTEAVLGGVAVGEVVSFLIKPEILNLFRQAPSLVVVGLIGALSLVTGLDSIIDTNRINHKSTDTDNPQWIETGPFT